MHWPPAGPEHRTDFPIGEIIGQTVNLGHIFREDRNFEVPPDNWESKKVAIVGGGVAGLTAAWKFKKQNFYDFVLFELEKEVGGTARSGQGDPVPYPWGAHYLPVPFEENRDLRELLSEMQILIDGEGSAEIIPEQYLCREPEERVFYKGRWYEGLYLNAGASDEDKRQFAGFQKQIDRWVNFRDASGKIGLLFCRSKIVQMIRRQLTWIKFPLASGSGRADSIRNA